MTLSTLRCDAVRLAIVSTLMLFAWPTLAQEQRSDKSDDSVYFIKSLDNLEVVGDPLSESTRNNLWRLSDSDQSGFAYAVLEGPGEIYFSARDVWRNTQVEVMPAEASEDVAPEGAQDEERAKSDEELPAPEGPRIAIQVPKRRDVVGTLYLSSGDDSRGGQGKFIELKFRIPASAATAKYRNAFLRTKRLYYEHLLQADIAGTAWFRHQVRATTLALGESVKTEGEWNPRRFFGTRRDDDMESTYALVSGGRAVSENLQLDRDLPTTAPKNAGQVEIDKIKGVTIKEFDWSSRIKDAKPQLDPLASFIPHDQHAVFFPSFSALTKFLDVAQVQGTPVLEAAEIRSESAMSLARYQQQMCLELGKIDRALGSSLIKSIAVTGGDVYFRTGTDVAVIFEAGEPAALRETLVARAKLAAKGNAEVESVEGKVRDVEYAGVRSTGREICCYVATIGDAVVVSNSLVQLERIAAVREGDGVTLADLPEYKFFRTRYPRGKDETAFVLLSDATIRRWTGPRWRIATSRRTRAAAVMSEVLAAHVDDVILNKVKMEQIEASHWVPEVDNYTLSSTGVSSSVYGTLAFQTPIGELSLKHATEEEAELYRRWREGYEENWSNFFDPIAARFVIAPQKMELDLTVMPLIEGSDYQQWIRISKGSSMKQHDGDPHPEALAHFALAINRKSDLLKQFNTTALKLLHINASPLSWIGDWSAVYLDEDSFWLDLSKAADPEDFMETNFYRLPLAIEVDTGSALRLVAFLTAAKSFIEQAAPGMTIWETKEFEGEKYVRIAPSLDAIDDLDELRNAALYYAPGDSLILTLNEEVLKRSLARRKTRRDPDKRDEARTAERRWLGENANVQVDQKLLPILAGALGEVYQRQMQRRAWGNLPILNEWKKKFPDQDPVAVHERLWGRQLVSPAGGSYEWNPRQQTMTSSFYGHPGEPKIGPGLPRALERVSFGNFGLTFEEDGLRTYVELLQGK